MQQFMLLHYGFEKPSADEMSAWKDWFDSIEKRLISKGHFPEGREISQSGVQALPFERHSITGYTLIRAETLDEAEQIAAACPIVDATRVYAIR